MSNVYFISDLHLGHSKILHYAPMRSGTTIEEHDSWIVKQWNSVVRKRDTVYILGDVAFSREGLERCRELHGTKKLVMGNHDGFKPTDYMDVGFRIMPGVMRYKSLWLSHAPIHPAELRGLPNVHGHVHQWPIHDVNYFPVCVEQLDGVPIQLERIQQHFRFLHAHNIKCPAELASLRAESPIC